MQTAGVSFGRFEVLSRIGVGGMGEVFRARMNDGGVPTDVALKLIRAEHANEARFQQMFATEARIGGLLRHPNVVRIVDFGQHEKMLYLAMELVEGVSLDRLIGKGPPPSLPMVAHIVVQLLDALEYAHHLKDETGQPLRLIHRDVSANNVLASTTGEVKLADFGVAKVHGVSLTVTNEVKGKRAYMAPEQMFGKTIDGRVDLFAVGVLLHELVRGRPPFSDSMQWIRDGAPVTSEGTLGRVLQKALAEQASDRFESAAQFAEAIRQKVTPSPEAAEELAIRVRQAMEKSDPIGKFDQLIIKEMVGTPQPPVAVTANVERAPPVKAAPPSDAATDMEERSTTLRARKRRRPLTIVISGLSAAVVGLLLIVLHDRRSPPPVVPIAAPARPPAPAPTPIGSLPDPLPAPGLVAPEPAPAPPEPIVARSPTPAAAPVRRPRPRPEPKEEIPGYLTLDTDPWAVASTRGRRLGTTPFAHLAIAPGTYRVSLNLRNSGRTEFINVKVTSGSVTRVSRQFR